MGGGGPAFKEGHLGLPIKSEKVYNTWYSQAVTHPSTNQARRCLT